MGHAPLDVASVYLATFAARTDVYSMWEPAPINADGEREEPGWRPKRRPLTPQLVVDALQKKVQSLSGFMIATDSTSHVLGIDFDLDNGVELAHRLGMKMWGDGIPAYVEPSRRGGHLWVTVERPVPAKTLRRATRYYLEQAGFGMVPDPKRPNVQIPDPKIEIRPGQDELPEGGLGLALRLPTMPHPKTGLRYALYAAYGNPLEFPLGKNLGDMLLEIQIAPAKFLIEAAMRFVPELDPRHIPKEYRTPKAEKDDAFANASASEMLREYWNVMNAQPGRAVRCPAHDDKNPSLSILRDDRRVICKAPSCILNNDGHGRGTYEIWKLSPKGQS